MAERPILFSAPMVRALLEGRKSQTRRLIKPTAKDADGVGVYIEDGSGVIEVVNSFEGEPIDAPPIRCPYGVAGDRLWVRESIRRVDDTSAVFAADGAPTRLDNWAWQRNVLPAMHCPRGLSRLTLEVTYVRVQRLQEISEEDARAEGVEPLGPTIGADQRIAGDMLRRTHGTHPFALAFAVLWDAINGERAAWATNPFVWAVSFKVAEARHG